MLIAGNDFYKKTLLILLKKDIINKNSKILIAAAGEKDKNKFETLGFKNVTITNLDERMNKDLFKPYKWDFQDVEELKYKNNEFDISVVHHGLHHCSSPHKGLTELLRVSKYGVLAFEPLDNFITKIGLLFKFSEEYELMAVYDHNFKYGGYKNTGIPNFVYRWTDNEVKKTVKSFIPEAKPEIKYFYGLDLPFYRLKKKKNKLYYLIALIAYPFLFVSLIIFHRHISNRYAFYIKKPDKTKLYPWIKVENNKYNPDDNYIKNIFIKK